MHSVTPPVAARAGTTTVAVAGATGYTGQELLRLLARHPSVQITAATSSGSTNVPARRLPALTRVWNGTITPLASDTLARDAELVFLALPDTAAAELAPALVDAGVRVVDLSGAFRLRDASARARWYPETHRLPAGVAYGLTELERGAVEGARLVANPGCYPTATLLALAPLVDAGLLVAGADIIVDAKSGVSGAGKTPSERTHFSECHGSLSAYGVFGHRHGAEIDQGVGRTVTFTPHLARSTAASSRRSTSASRPAPRKRRLATCSSAPTAARRSCGWSDRRCRKSSTSRTRTSATSAGAWTRRGAPSWSCLLYTSDAADE